MNSKMSPLINNVLYSIIKENVPLMKAAFSTVDDEYLQSQKKLLGRLYRAFDTEVKQRKSQDAPKKGKAKVAGR